MLRCIVQNGLSLQRTLWGHSCTTTQQFILLNYGIVTQKAPHGLHHATQPLRYRQHYDYQPREQFLEDLGDDVHPVRHMLYTHTEITVPFLLAQRVTESGFERFSKVQEVQLLTAAAIHDTGECTSEDISENVGYVLGDVAYGDAPEDHKQREKAIRGYLYDLYFQDVPPNLLQRVDEIDLRETNDICVEAFEVIERLGYYTTACQARDVVMAEKRNPQPSHRISQLARLATIVGYSHYNWLRSRESKFAYLKPALDRLISQTVVV